LVKNQAGHDALSQLARAISKAQRAFDEASEHHKDHKIGDFKLRPEATLGITAAIDDIDEIDEILGACYPDVFTSAIGDTMLYIALSHAGWSKLTTLESAAGYCCYYAETLSSRANSCAELLIWIRRARMEVLSGNYDAPILNEGFTVYRDRRWPVSFGDPVPRRVDANLDRQANPVHWLAAVRSDHTS